MITFPNAKINIGLQITGKRPDGFHELETVFYPVGLKDVLEITEADTFSFTVSGTSIEGKGENICIKAYQLVKKDHPGLPAVKMHLHKAIPVGAGLGGGSSDAAACLQLLNKKFNLGITENKLMEYALQLGSDCPFFIINRPCLATGRGENLKAVSLNLQDHNLIIINPGIHINTSWAFSQLKELSASASIEKAFVQPISEWKKYITNDFEKIVFSAHPEIGKIKDDLYKNGALYASMSGSGSSVYGIFHKVSRPALTFPGNYFSKWL